MILTESEPPESDFHHVNTVTIFQTNVMYRLLAMIWKMGFQNVL